MVRKSLQELVRKILTVSVLMVETMLMTYWNLGCLLGGAAISLITDEIDREFMYKATCRKVVLLKCQEKKLYPFSNGNKIFADVDQNERQRTDFTIGITL